MPAIKKKEKGKLGRVLHLYRRAMGLMFRESGAYTMIVCGQWILRFCAPYWGIWFSARLLDEVLGERVPERLVKYVVCLLLGNLVLEFLKELLDSLEAQKHYNFFQKEIMIFAGKVMELDYDLLEDEELHMLYRRVGRETTNDGKNLETLRRHLPLLMGSVAGIGMSLFMVWDLLARMKDQAFLLLLFVLLVAAGIWVSARCSAATSRVWEECNGAISEYCARRDGYMNYFSQYGKGKEVRIYGLGKLLIDRLMQSHHFVDKEGDKRDLKALFHNSIVQFSQKVTMTVTYCLTGFAALAGMITFGSMLQYVQSLTHFIDHISCCGEALVTLWYNAEYLERYFAFLDTPSHMQKGCLPVEKRVDSEYKIVFDHVSFRYPGSDKYALKDISIEFKVGEKLAVVGMNGSGKSTFIKLLCRLYDPTEGTIYMNGIDIRRYDYQEYFGLFSVVFQDFRLFSFGLGENVAMSETFREEAVRDALVKAGMEEFLKEHNDDLSTTLYRDFDKNGVEVSGGEAQKIALARAVCKGAPFVLLDEPTAALDPKAEYEIYKRFNDLVADRTTVYISHRMSSCRFCGDIAVFHEGRMVQRGSHESLLEETTGKYYELWTAQAQYYVTE